MCQITYKDRLKMEALELETRIERLQSYMESKRYERLDDMQQDLLKSQINSMQTYLSLLELRITTAASVELKIKQE